MFLHSDPYSFRWSGAVWCGYNILFFKNTTFHHGELSFLFHSWLVRLLQWSLLHIALVGFHSGFDHGHFRACTRSIKFEGLIGLRTELQGPDDVTIKQGGMGGWYGYTIEHNILILNSISTTRGGGMVLWIKRQHPTHIGGPSFIHPKMSIGDRNINILVESHSRIGCPIPVAGRERIIQ